MTGKAFSGVLISVLTMLGVAGWQFYSLAFKPVHVSQTAALDTLPPGPMTPARHGR